MRRVQRSSPMFSLHRAPITSSERERAVIQRAQVPRGNYTATICQSLPLSLMLFLKTTMPSHRGVNYKDDFRLLHPNHCSPLCGLEDPDVGQTLLKIHLNQVESVLACQVMGWLFLHLSINVFKYKSSANKDLTCMK